MKQKLDLSNAKIWISGALPELEHWPHPLYDRDVLSFLKLFCNLVFKNNGTIIHGSHPSFTPVIFNQFLAFKGHRKSQLQLHVSNFFEHSVTNKYSEDCTVQEAPRKSTLETSLTLLRENMSHEANILVVLGGKHHQNSSLKPGVVEETELALLNGMKVIVLPHFHGAARKYIKPSKNIEIISDDVDLNILAHQLTKKISTELNPGIVIKLLRIFSRTLKQIETKKEKR